jgi:hypothetical protein
MFFINVAVFHQSMTGGLLSQTTLGENREHAQEPPYFWRHRSCRQSMTGGS